MRSYNYDAAERLRRKHVFDRVRRKKAIHSRGPNKVEWKLYKALGSGFSYSGDGSFTIDGLRPDFVCKARRVVVELYGNYWHRNESIEKTARRIGRFAKEGWRTVIIWEDEVHDPMKLRRKLALL